MIHRERDDELAERLGLSGPAFSQWRERTDPPDTGKVEVLAKLTGLEFDWLLRGERSVSEAPREWATFVVVYRDWVRRGGLKRGRTKKAAPGITRERTTTVKVEEKGKKRA